MLLLRSQRSAASASRKTRQRCIGAALRRHDASALAELSKQGKQRANGLTRGSRPRTIFLITLLTKGHLHLSQLGKARVLSATFSVQFYPGGPGAGFHGMIRRITMKPVSIGFI